MSTMRRTFVVSGSVVVAAAALAFFLGLGGRGVSSAGAADSSGGADQGPRVLWNRDRSGVAILGYDPVAYFTDGKPLAGDPRFTASYQGATFRFASAAHRDQFAAEPAKYAPQFGGYCGYAASIDRLSPIAPEFWQNLDGRLVLQHNQRALDAWNRDVPGNLVKADANWPGLVAQHGRAARQKSLINRDEKGVAIQGYDPVAYFTVGRPVAGDAQFDATYDGALYHFASKDNRETFERDPSLYAPKYGGYCGYAASINKVSPIDPRYWQILDGRLILQHTQKAFDLFNQDAAGNARKADANWPGLVERRGA